MMPRCLIAVFVLITALVQSAEVRRPNFLFLYTDDQRWDAMSVVQEEMGERARFPWFKTPNLDRLASQGTRFRNAFVVMALCAPSRAAFLTGRYNHLNGIANNHTPFPTNNVTWAAQLRAAGYTTAYIGKWHMGSQRGQRPGFDYSASFIGHARYFDAPFEINGVETATKGWVDDVSTDFAIEFLRQNRSKPVALAVGFKTPHGPFEPPPRWADKFSEGYLKTAPNIDTTPPFPGPIRQGPAAPAPHGPPGSLNANLNYFRCIAAVDENVGRLMKALEELQLAEDTMVVYASDNGFYLGEHRLGDKRSAYDESMRIPLLLRYPKLGQQARVNDELVLNIDFAPTILDYAGVQIPSQVQGRSWRTLLEGRATGWRRSFLFEYFWEPQRGNPTPSLTAVRTRTAKLIRYKDHPEWTELFDLTRDPYEIRNLYGMTDSAALQAELETEYDAQRRQVGYVWPEYADDPEKLLPGKGLQACVLDYELNQRSSYERVIDSSGQDNHGQARGIKIVKGRDGKEAGAFDGKALIDVPKSRSLNPAVRAWTVEVVLKLEKPDGVVLARGGAATGYCLYFSQGKPTFAVRAMQTISRVEGKRLDVGQWAHLRAGYNEKNELVLRVDDAPPQSVALKEGIERDPNDGMQIGADSGSQVLDKPVPGFTGLIERVRVHSGVAP